MADEYLREYRLPNVDNSESTDNWHDWFTTEALPGIPKIEANWSWHDQGWGNQKGRIRAVLVRSGVEVATLQIGPIASHEPSNQSFVATEGELIEKSQFGDSLRFEYLVGGGGGHTLHIGNFVVKIFERIEEFALPNVDNSESTDDWHDWFTTEALPAISKIEATWSWHDQGWGNLKGTIRAVLVRNGADVATLQIGPIAGHEPRTEHFTASKVELINLSQDGDVLKFQYLVGGGGGHTLHIENFVVKIYARSLRDYQLPNVDNSNSNDDWIDWLTTDKLTAIRSFVADWTWRDQGWGNQKGRIRVVLTREGQEVATLQVGPIAGHSDTKEHFVATNGELIDLSQDGDVLKFQYIVGGGGGHQLFINNFAAKIFG